MDVDGDGTSLYVGGIAGNMGTAGTVDAAHVTGNINVVGKNKYPYVAGITPTAKTITNSTVKIDTLSLNINDTGVGSTNTLSGIGAALVTDCSAAIAHIKAVSAHTTGAHSFYVGGIAATSGSSASIERCHVYFEDMIVEAVNGRVGGSNIGGIASSLSSSAKVSDCTVEGGTITVNFPGISNAGQLQVGGLAGQGNIENSSVSALEIDITDGGTGQINAGGLTGHGAAQYSFIGMATEQVKVKVRKTDTTLKDTNIVHLGGISGYADALSASLPFQYNYAFCDVTLITAGATTSVLGQRVGGLVGTVMYSGAGLFTQNYAVGTVTFTNNYTTGNENTPVIYASGIAGFYDYTNTGFTVSKCAALGSVVIDGDNTAATKNWRRIVNTQNNTTLANNITTIADDAGPQGHSLDSGSDKEDGFYVASVTEDTFFGKEENQLGWDTDVWKWENGYPVFK
jgi:hypothetical protein